MISRVLSLGLNFFEVYFWFHLCACYIKKHFQSIELLKPKSLTQLCNLYQKTFPSHRAFKINIIHATLQLPTIHPQQAEDRPKLCNHKLSLKQTSASGWSYELTWNQQAYPKKGKRDQINQKPKTITYNESTSLLCSVESPVSKLAASHGTIQEHKILLSKIL